MNKPVDLTGRSSFAPVALHDDMGVEVIKGTVAFCTARPRAVIEALNLVVTSAGTLSDGISGKRDKRVSFGYRRIRGYDVVLVLGNHRTRNGNKGRGR
jgi:hypothetical protein